MRTRTVFFSAMTVTALAALCTTLAALASPSVIGSRLAIPPVSEFSARVDNRWFPLKPGTVYVYRGVKDGHPARDVLKVTHETTKIDGVPCVVIHDRLYLSGRLAERTTDWYSQDKQGNVWYFGEATAVLDKNGHVTSSEGSFKAGVDGAQPGIYMTRNPKPGQSARQEYYKGHAEDHFKVIQLNASVKVPYLSSKRALLTKEWTPLEPGVLDHKLYVSGIGTVLEVAVKGGTERLELVSFKRGA